jgi:hypothetical protein
MPDTDDLERNYFCIWKTPVAPRSNFLSFALQIEWSRPDMSPPTSPALKYAEAPGHLEMQSVPWCVSPPTGTALTCIKTDSDSQHPKLWSHQG